MVMMIYFAVGVGELVESLLSRRRIYEGSFTTHHLTVSITSFIFRHLLLNVQACLRAASIRPHCSTSKTQSLTGTAALPHREGSHESVESGRRVAVANYNQAL